MYAVVCLLEQMQVRYHMARMKACDKLEIFRTKPSLGAWDLDANIPDVQRLVINREISMLHMEHVVQGMQKDMFGKDLQAACEPHAPTVDGNLLVLFLAVSIGPLAVSAVVFLLVGFILELVA